MLKIELYLPIFYVRHYSMKFKRIFYLLISTNSFKHFEYEFQILKVSLHLSKLNIANFSIDLLKFIDRFISLKNI